MGLVWRLSDRLVCPFGQLPEGVSLWCGCGVCVSLLGVMPLLHLELPLCLSSAACRRVKSVGESGVPQRPPMVWLWWINGVVMVEGSCFSASVTVTVPAVLSWAESCEYDANIFGILGHAACKLVPHVFQKLLQASASRVRRRWFSTSCCCRVPHASECMWCTMRSILTLVILSALPMFYFKRKLEV